MSNAALAIYSQFNTIKEAGAALATSGYFKSSQAEAIARVMAGAELGIAPFAAMSGIHIINGKPTLSANLIATLVDNHPRYDFRVLEQSAKRCEIEWRRDGEVVGKSDFTIDEAKAAGLTGKQTWKAYASDMLFARALTRGCRRFAPGIFGGAPAYTPEELGVEVDQDGFIEAEVVEVAAPAVTAKEITRGVLGDAWVKRVYEVGGYAGMNTAEVDAICDRECGAEEVKLLTEDQAKQIGQLLKRMVEEQEAQEEAEHAEREATDPDRNADAPVA